MLANVLECFRTYHTLMSLLHCGSPFSVDHLLTMLKPLALLFKWLTLTIFKLSFVVDLILLRHLFLTMISSSRILTYGRTSHLGTFIPWHIPHHWPFFTLVCYIY